MDAGKMNCLVQIQRQSTTRDAGGQKTGAWDLFTSVWANIRHQSGEQSIQAEAEVSVVRASIRIRWRTDVTAAMRVQHGAAVYEIRAVLPDQATRRWVDLVCEQVTNG